MNLSAINVSGHGPDDDGDAKGQRSSFHDGIGSTYRAGVGPPNPPPLPCPHPTFSSLRNWRCLSPNRVNYNVEPVTGTRNVGRQVRTGCVGATVKHRRRASPSNTQRTVRRRRIRHGQVLDGFFSLESVNQVLDGCPYGVKWIRRWLKRPPALSRVAVYWKAELSEWNRRSGSFWQSQSTNRISLTGFNTVRLADSIRCTQMISGALYTPTHHSATVPLKLYVLVMS